MSRYGLLRILTVALIAVAAVPALQSTPARAQTPPHSPPANIDAVHPTVSGTLVAKPTGGQSSPSAPCGANNSTLAPSVKVRRALVVCTDAGRLVLLQLSSQTGIYSRYWAPRALARLTVGDHINGWGVLIENGYELNPTFAVQDTDIQEAYTDSQDYISQAGPTLTLYVLKSDAKGPVQGIVQAVQGGKTQITLCNGTAGTWSDLQAGQTIDISRSLFNQRLKTYIHTGKVRVVGCS